MTNLELFIALGDISPENLSGAEALQKMPFVHQNKNIKRAILIAAVIALSLLLAGCGIVYALRLRNLKIGEQGFARTQDDASEMGETTVQLDVLSMQGIKGSPNYLANQAWLAFTQNYQNTGGEYWESEPEYWAYSLQNQQMQDKLDEICAQYGLNVIGKPWHEHKDCAQFLALAGVGNLLKGNSQATLWLPQGRFFPGGSFTVYGSLTLSGGEQPLDLTYHCVKKDVFYDVFTYVDANVIKERNYTTDDGITLLLLESEQDGMILWEGEDCFFSIGIALGGDASLEEVAEQFDYTIHPQPLDTAAADAREQASLAESNGMDPNFLRRDTYEEYVEDLLWSERRWLDDPDVYQPKMECAFYDLDGNGEQELLIFYDGYIGSVVGMKDGKTDEGKSYHMKLYEGNILIEINEWDYGPLAGTTYHIFTFANNDDPVFSNPKEQSIVRLWKDQQGIWRRTSSTDHYAEYDTQISQEEAMDILNSYQPLNLDKRPLTELPK